MKEGQVVFISGHMTARHLREALTNCGTIMLITRVEVQSFAEKFQEMQLATQKPRNQGFKPNISDAKLARQNQIKRGKK